MESINKSMNRPLSDKTISANTGLNTIVFTDDEIKNLMIFLNRVDYKGLVEVQAVYTLIEKIQKSVTGNMHPPD